MGKVRTDRKNARLSVEFLEGRVCPAKGFAIAEFSAVALPNHIARLTGKVLDTHPEMVRLEFTGGVEGTTTPDAGGHFLFETPEADPGMIWVDGVNYLDQVDQNQDLLNVAPPVVSLGIEYGPQRTVTLSGTVVDLDPGGLVVEFRGMAPGSAVTDASGFFSFTTSALGLGKVNAFATNDWGLRSAPVSVTIQNKAPIIVNFNASKSPDGLWHFSGSVSDESAAGLVVYFSNCSQLAGRSAVVGANGEFHLTVSMRLTKPVQVHANVTDWWGLAADPTWVNLEP